jgi:hypothetical protein
MNALLQKILISVATAAVLGILTLLRRSIWNALFYQRVEYDLSCKRASGQSPFTGTWDIHWEDYRLTFKAGDISDNRIKDATFEKLGGKSENVQELFPSDAFRPLFDSEIQMKLNSIIRFEPASGPREYTLRLVFRRRRRIL